MRPTPDDGGNGRTRFGALFWPTPFAAGIVAEPANRSDKKDFGSPRYVSGIEIVDRRDAFLEGVCRRQTVLHSLVGAETTIDQRQLWTDWVASRDGMRGTPTELDNGMWRLTLPAAGFGDEPLLKYTRFGTFAVSKGCHVRLWCDEPIARACGAGPVSTVLNRHRRGVEGRPPGEPAVAPVPDRLGP